MLTLAAAGAAACDSSDSRCLLSSSGDGGFGFRGGGLSGSAAAACALGVRTEHPTPHGFRIQVVPWLKSARIRWQFDVAVSLKRNWGPATPLPTQVPPHARSATLPPAPRSDGASAPPQDATVLEFELRNPPPRRRVLRPSGRTDQFGFVLADAYDGATRTSCTLPERGAPPPSPAPPAAPASNSAPPPSPADDARRGRRRGRGRKHRRGRRPR